VHWRVQVVNKVADTVICFVCLCGLAIGEFLLELPSTARSVYECVSVYSGDGAAVRKVTEVSSDIETGLYAVRYRC